MSIPLDEIYHYINDCLDDDAIIYRFWPSGSKNIEDFNTVSHHTRRELDVNPIILCCDHEPLDFDAYEKSAIKEQYLKFYPEESYQIMPDYNLGYDTFRNQYQKRILLHSELNSAQVDRYQQTGFFHPIFWWSHAILARDWYRYAKHDPQNVWPKSLDHKVVNIYARAWTNTREYRLTLLEKLLPYNLSCQVRFSSIDGCHYKYHTFKNQKLKIKTEDLEKYYCNYDSQSSLSASYSVDDYRNSLFDLVLETVVEDRIHLTEKILRPIALGQPFILMAGAGSLEFLKSFGFKTFSKFINESYDQEDDILSRMDCIVDIVKHLVQKKWSPSEMNELKNICDYNKKLFFSDEFFNRIMSQLKTDLQNGLKQIKDQKSDEWTIWVKKVLTECSAETAFYHLKKWSREETVFLDRLKLSYKN